MRLGTTSLSVTRPGAVRKYAAAAGGASSNGFEDISNYSHVRFDRINVDSGDAVLGIAFRTNGTKMWTVDQNKRLKQQNLSTAWDISTAGSETSSINLGFGNPVDFPAPREVRFKPDGTMLWVNDFYGVIREYTTSAAWSTTGMSHTASRDFGNRLQGFFWKPDGTALFLIDSSTDKIHKKVLATAWDITSTITSSTSSIDLDLSTTAGETSNQSLFFSPDGLKIYFTGVTTDKVHMYNLATAWDIRSSSFSGVPDDYLDFSSYETAPQVITFSDDGKHLYVGGAAGDGVDQFSRP